MTDLANAHAGAAAEPTPPGAAPTVDLERHRVELTAYCYRMLGSAFEAEDAVQETFVRAWRGLDRVRGPRQPPLLAVPHRHERLPLHARRQPAARPAHGPAAAPRSADTPLADAAARERLDRAGARWAGRPDRGGDPAEVAIARESVRLAFVAALQHLPPKPAGGADPARGAPLEGRARSPSCSTRRSHRSTARSSARGRRWRRSQDASDAPDGAARRRAAGPAGRYVDAFERYDMDALTSLLREDADVEHAAVRPVAADPRRHRGLVPRARDRLRGVAPAPDDRRTAPGLRPVQARSRRRPRAVVAPGRRARRDRINGDHLLPRHGPPGSRCSACRPISTDGAGAHGSTRVQTAEGDQLDQLGRARRRARTGNRPDRRAARCEPGEVADRPDVAAAQRMDVDVDRVAGAGPRAAPCGTRSSSSCRPDGRAAATHRSQRVPVTPMSSGVRPRSHLTRHADRRPIPEDHREHRPRPPTRALVDRLRDRRARPR